jgi:hypothetical protein
VVDFDFGEDIKHLGMGLGIHMLLVFLVTGKAPSCVNTL